MSSISSSVRSPPDTFRRFGKSPGGRGRVALHAAPTAGRQAEQVSCRRFPKLQAPAPDAGIDLSDDLKALSTDLDRVHWLSRESSSNCARRWSTAKAAVAGWTLKIQEIVKGERLHKNLAAVFTPTHFGCGLLLGNLLEVFGRGNERQQGLLMLSDGLDHLSCTISLNPNARDSSIQFQIAFADGLYYAV